MRPLPVVTSHRDNLYADYVRTEDLAPRRAEPVSVSHQPVAIVPRSLEAAVATHREWPELTVVNGGTDVMVGVNEGTRKVVGWLSIRRVRGMDEITRAGDGIIIGAGANFDTLQLALRTTVPALAAAARTVGSPQIRRVATIGGNLITASPAADAVPALMCHDAQLELVSADSSRRVPIEEFATGPKRTALRAGELLASIHLPSLGGVELFAKVGVRNAMVISVCSIAARLDISCGIARVALGSVAPTVRRAREAEQLLLDPQAGDEFGDAVVRAADPIDDHRATAAYRRHALGVLGRRTHRRLWHRADAVSA